MGSKTNAGLSANGRYNVLMMVDASEAVDDFRRLKLPVSVIEWSDGSAELTTGNVLDVIEDVSIRLEEEGWTGTFRVRPATKADVDAVADILSDEAIERAESEIDDYRRSYPEDAALRDAAAAFGEWI